MEAEPKSPSFTCPGSVNRIFPAFTSLEKTELELKSRIRSKDEFGKMGSQRGKQCENWGRQEGRKESVDVPVCGLRQR